MSRTIDRPGQAEVVEDFLAAARSGSAALIIEGEAGIGKTTVWLSATEVAARRGFQVLVARPSAAESVLAYGSLADMLRGVDPGMWEHLPAPQRAALERVLLRADGTGPVDQRAVAAGFRSVVDALAGAGPVLLAIDDLQWLDTSSRLVIEFAARRMPAGVGLLATLRTDPSAPANASWVQLRDPQAVRRMVLPPFGLASLRELLLARLGRSFSRAALVRIHEIARGNPFYALELARATTDDRIVRLPDSLAELVRARIDRLSEEARTALLAVSCSSTPTVERVARATESHPEAVIGVLAEAIDDGIVSVEGHQIRFTHPLLAHGVHDGASFALRRSMHRRLAGIETEPELRARHLAMAAVSGDPDTLACLDAAAQSARRRGAPAAAAELADLAIGLGGDTPQRRIVSARNHFDAGDGERARKVLKHGLAALEAGPERAEMLSLLGAIEALDGSYLDAAQLLQRAIDEVGDEPASRARFLVLQAFARLNIGRRDTAAADVDEAVACAIRCGNAHLLSQALAMQCLMDCVLGRDFDPAKMRRALELEDPGAECLALTRPKNLHAMVLAYTGQLDEAARATRGIAEDCADRGEEVDQLFSYFHRVLVEIWRGDLHAADEIGSEAIELAQMLDGGVTRGVGLMLQHFLACYRGEVERARRLGSEALTALEPSYCGILINLVVTLNGFLEVSQGNYPQAVDVLEPLLAQLDPDLNGTEIIVGWFLPDLAEALIHSGRGGDAEPLVAALERNGRRLDRAWMTAVGGRCRAMLLAAGGDVDAAVRTAEEAMRAHDRTPMRFERARTLLVLGQLQRRRRRRDAATVALREALDAFERIGTPLWAERARAELHRGELGAGFAGLSETERRVAELSAAGMTNRDVAATLFISPKTVETYLGRIYRKLGIHSRAELGRLMAEQHQPDDK
jgi:DNA-binding CsgD family transcriptional regulator